MRTIIAIMLMALVVLTACGQKVQEQQQIQTETPSAPSENLQEVESISTDVNSIGDVDVSDMAISDEDMKLLENI